MSEKIHKEQETFNKLLPGLLKDGGHQNQWVVFKDGKVQGYYPSAFEAYDAGCKQFGVQGGFVIDYVAVHYPIQIY
jgi:hypothetical protein